jgi:outer membrane PBP1 activator LpoA protein
MMPTQPTIPAARSTEPRFVLAGFALLLLLAGCGVNPVTAPPSVDRAARLAQAGDHAGAATMYERLAAANPPPDGITFGFSAVHEWIAANRPDDAQRAFAAIPAQPADATQAQERRYLDVEVQLARGQYAEGWRLANSFPEPRPLRALQLQQRAAFAASRPADAVRIALAVDKLATSDAERTAGRRDLLLQLRRAVERGAKLDPQAQRDAPVRGWLELGAIAANAARAPLSAARDIERWRTRYPGHPGTSIAMAEIMGPTGPSTLASVAGTQVAVLLPLTGRQSVAATLVRDGFLAAVSLLPEAQRPVVKVYDTGEASVGAALLAAQAEGAGFIVGPLTREETVTAVNENTRRTPMLLLNALPVELGTPANVWQFALSPEDEARQIARRALEQGQRRALIFAPSGDWGTRVVAAFREELAAGGGTVLDSQAYDPARSEFTPQITAALRIDESRARHKRIESIVGGKLQFEPRRRGDIDFIFAAGQPVALRQIRPQLRFFYAGDVPTYMTSDSFDPDAGANRDLDGMLFPDMPWMLQEQGSVADTRTATQAAWSDKGLRLPRLFAFGYDAGQLVLALRNPQWQWPLGGVTGRLTPDAQRRIRRELDWAQIAKSGKPLPVGNPAP